MVEETGRFQAMGYNCNLYSFKNRNSSPFDLDEKFPCNEYPPFIQLVHPRLVHALVEEHDLVGEVLALAALLPEREHLLGVALQVVYLKGKF
jgi:hypothetical protein